MYLFLMEAFKVCALVLSNFLMSVSITSERDNCYNACNGSSLTFRKDLRDIELKRESV